MIPIITKALLDRLWSDALTQQSHTKAGYRLEVVPKIASISETPHIWKHDGAWFCAGRGKRGHGETPKDAYLFWQMRSYEQIGRVIVAVNRPR